MTRSTMLGAVAVSLALAGAVAGCNNGNGPNGNNAAVNKTGFPGQVTAGGGTSGDVIAQAKGGVNTQGPSGTPGIPQGKGGNTGGAAMGGTTGATGSQEGANTQPPNTGGAPAAATSGVPATQSAASQPVAPPAGGAAGVAPAAPARQGNR